MRAHKTSPYDHVKLDPTLEERRQSQFRDTSSSLDEEPYTAQRPANREKTQIIRRRKGHKKSRRGCFNCKKARMKCNENRPTCDYCLHRDFYCEWPEKQASQIGQVSETPIAEKIENILQSSTPVFTVQDFRLFSHFIESAYPHRPFGNDSVWTREIPSISSDYDYLLYSMLALSASNIAITQSSTPELTQTALAHRLKAIASLNAAVSTGIRSFEEGNAMFATCYNLFVQSTLIDDGLIDYMTFIRGSIIISKQMLAQGMEFVFHSIWGDDSVSTLNPSLKDAPLIDADRVKAACKSLEGFKHLCLGQVETEMHGLLLSTARALFASSWDAFMELRKIYALFASTMSHEDFCHFTDPANDVGRLLLAHFVGLHSIISPIVKIALGDIAEKGDDRWLNAMRVNNIPKHMLEYYKWRISLEQGV